MKVLPKYSTGSKFTSESKCSTEEDLRQEKLRLHLNYYTYSETSIVDTIWTQK